MLGGDDEGRRLVVGIGGAGADAGDEGARRVERRAVPVALRAGERHHACRLRRSCAGHEHDRIDAHELPVVVGVARAGARRARPDAAQHRAGIAAHDAVAFRGAEFGAPPRRDRSRS